MLNRWIVLFWGIALSFVLLIAIPEGNFVFCSISVTFVAVLSIGYYLYKRYSKKLTLQSDLLISINTLIQFLLPVFYLVFYYQANLALDFHNFRYGFAITSFAALVGQTMFFLGYESIKKSLYLPRVKIYENSYIRLFLVFLPLAIAIWAARIVLLSTGSYYHIYRSDYQSTSHLYSVFAQLSNYGLIIILALFLIAFSEEREVVKKRKMTIAVVVLGLELLWYLPSGSRENIGMTILAPIIAFVFIKRRVPKLTLITLLLVSIPIIAIYGEYRYTISSHIGINKIEIRETLSALIESRAVLKQQKYNTIAGIMDRAYDGRSLNYLLMHYSDDYDYELGITYKNIPFVFIPRFIYPDKPVFTTPLDYWYKLIAGGSSPITFWGESYINFSWFGIIFMSYILGLGMKSYDSFFAKRISKPYWLYLYCFSLLFILRFPMQAAVVWVSDLLKTIVLAFFFTGLHTIVLSGKKISTNFSKQDRLTQNRRLPNYGGLP